MNYNIANIKPFGVVIQPKDDYANIRDLDVKILRKLFDKENLILLRGFNTFKEKDEFADYCKTWGKISIWPFGKVLELVEQINPKDHIFDNSYMPLHWDGMYRPQVPEYQIFHCIKAPLPGQGGRTTFSNTILTLKNTPQALREFWEGITGTYQRKMEFYDSKTISPIITKHPFKDYSVIRYNESHSKNKGHLINEPKIKFSGVNNERLDEFRHDLEKALYNPQNFYAHEWQPGDIVIADNFSLLHGREKFVSKSSRHIQRVHVLSDPPFDNPYLKSYQ